MSSKNTHGKHFRPFSSTNDNHPFPPTHLRMLKPLLNPSEPNNSKTENKPAKSTTKNNTKNAYKHGQTHKNPFTTKQSKKKRSINQHNNKNKHLNSKPSIIRHNTHTTYPLEQTQQPQ
jgi:hypothetical protein